MPCCPVQTGRSLVFRESIRIFHLITTANSFNYSVCMRPHSIHVAFSAKIKRPYSSWRELAAFRIRFLRWMTRRRRATVAWWPAARATSPLNIEQKPLPAAKCESHSAMHTSFAFLFFTEYVVGCEFAQSECKGAP